MFWGHIFVIEFFLKLFVFHSPKSINCILRDWYALSEVVWMQNGSSLHVESSAKLLLCQQFGVRIISRHFQFPWPPRSSDLTPMDFWLWGYVKSKVHQFDPQTESDLKDAIKIMVRAAEISTICLMQSVIVCEGGHVENL